MIEELFKQAKAASKILRNSTESERNAAILKVAAEIENNADEILAANALDIEAARKIGTSDAMLDRLLLTSSRIDAIVADMKKIALLSSPVGEIEKEWTTDNGLNIQKVRVPFGVIGVIYEARPNVTVDVFTLCIKNGNACLLKGGSDAAVSNKAIVSVIQKALAGTALPSTSAVLLPTDRSATEELIHAKNYVDLLIPRGGKGLINYVVQNATIPVIETGAGVCHTYVEKSADLNMALNILKNAKMSRPSVCNACETLLVDEEIAEKFLKLVMDNIKGLRILGGEKEKTIVSGISDLTADGYYSEYHDYVLSVKIVKNACEAVEHINSYGTHHSDCIVTSDKTAEDYFMNNVDSACVYLNASTRFSDGGCFGFGAELGISTQKSHARGPMGLYEMTTYFYKIYGEGQIR